MLVAGGWYHETPRFVGFLRFGTVVAIKEASKQNNERNDTMARKKAITSATTEIAKRKMTDAEIKEAIKRDKECMDRIDPDEEIEVPKGMLKDIFDDLKRKLDDEEADDADADDVEELDPEDSECEIDDVENDSDDDEEENDDDTECDDTDNEAVYGDIDDDGVDGGGKIVGALIGGIGGLVLGGILGAALLDD